MVSEEETEISSFLWGELDSGPRRARRWGWVGRRRGSAADLGSSPLITWVTVDKVLCVSASPEGSPLRDCHED